MAGSVPKYRGAKVSLTTSRGSLSMSRRRTRVRCATGSRIVSKNPASPAPSSLRRLGASWRTDVVCPRTAKHVGLAGADRLHAGHVAQAFEHLEEAGAALSGPRVRPGPATRSTSAVAKPGLTFDILANDSTSRPPTKRTTRPKATCDRDERTHHAGARHRAPAAGLEGRDRRDARGAQRRREAEEECGQDGQHRRPTPPRASPSAGRAGPGRPAWRAC